MTHTDRIALHFAVDGTGRLVCLLKLRKPLARQDDAAGIARALLDARSDAPVGRWAWLWAQVTLVEGTDATYRIAIPRVYVVRTEEAGQ